jgi:hypothetical protein
MPLGGDFSGHKNIKDTETNDENKIGLHGNHF